MNSLHTRALDPSLHLEPHNAAATRTHLRLHELDVGLQPARPPQPFLPHNVARRLWRQTVIRVLAAARLRKRASDVVAFPLSARCRVGAGCRGVERQVAPF
eukprot:3861162-Pleurochrysis_carterae.AAC.1